MNSQHAKQLSEFGAAPIKLPSNVHELAQLKAQTRVLAQELNNKVGAENRDFTPEEQLKFDGYMEVLKATTAKLDHNQRHGSFTGGPRSETGINLSGLAGMGYGVDSPAEGKGLGRVLTEALKHATEEEHEQAESLVAYLRTGNFSAAADLTPSGDGGVLIPAFVSGTIERNFAAFTPVLNVCRQLPTDTGAPITVPVMSDSETGVLVAPAASTGADATVSGDTPPTALTGPTLHAYKISSKPVYVPPETLIDGSGDIMSDVLAALLARVARYENYLYTRGSGSGQPQGVVTAATALLEASQLDLDVTLDLAYSVPALYRPNGIFMMSDATAKYLRKLKTGISGDKRVIWTDRNFQTGQPATLHGYRVEINNDLPDIAANGYVAGHEIIFGDFSKFVVRRAENGSPFVYNYQVPAKDGRGLIVFRRSDSKLLVPEAIAKLSVGGS